jgi:hypothetical protein
LKNCFCSLDNGKRNGHFGERIIRKTDNDGVFGCRDQVALDAALTVECRGQANGDGFTDFAHEVARQAQCALETWAGYFEGVTAWNRVGVIKLARDKTSDKGDVFEADTCWATWLGIDNNADDAPGVFDVVEVEAEVGHDWGNEGGHTIDDRARL